MPITLPLQPTADDLVHLEKVRDEGVRNRIIIERAIVRRAVTDLIAAGYEIRVSDGESLVTKRTQDVGVIMAAICACDEEWLRCWKVGDAGNAAIVYLVYGNDGWDVIADNSVSLEPHLAGASKLADEIADAVVEIPQWLKDRSAALEAAQAFAAGTAGAKLER